MKTIKLRNGGTARVDDSDYEYLKLKGWSRSSGGYAYRSETRGGVKRQIFMHRVILGLGEWDEGVEGDHVDGDGLNNQRSNLRACTHLQNSKNRAKNRNGRHSSKGVSHEPNRRGAKKWRGQIWIRDATSPRGRLLASPLFMTEADAAEWYDAQAVKHHGEFSRTNRRSRLLPQKGAGECHGMN